MIISAIFSGLTGLLFLSVGLFVLKGKTVWLLAGYKPGVYDEELLSKIAGWHLIVLGLNHLFFSVLCGLITEHAALLLMLMNIGFFVILVKMIYTANKHCKIEKQPNAN